MDRNRILIVVAALAASCAMAGPQWRETPGAAEKRASEKAQEQAIADMAAARKAYQAARTQQERDEAILAFFEQATTAQSNSVAAAKAEQAGRVQTAGKTEAGAASGTGPGTGRNEK